MWEARETELGGMVFRSRRYILSAILPLIMVLLFDEKEDWVVA